MAPLPVVRILDGCIDIRREKKSPREKKTKEKIVIAYSVHATSTGAGSIGRAAIDSAAPVLLGAGAISGSGIWISS